MPGASVVSLLNPRHKARGPHLGGVAESPIASNILCAAVMVPPEMLAFPPDPEHKRARHKSPIPGAGEECAYDR